MANVFKDYRKESRADWGTTIEEKETIQHESIQLGAILRIADATEMMARNYQQLIDERVRYERWYKEECKRTQKLQRQVNAYKGIVKKKGGGK